MALVVGQLTEGPVGGGGAVGDVEGLWAAGDRGGLGCRVGHDFLRFGRPGVAATEELNVAFIEMSTPCLCFVGFITCQTEKSPRSAGLLVNKLELRRGRMGLVWPSMWPRLS